MSMEVIIELKCTSCNSVRIKKNGIKNYQCFCCCRQFISDYALKNKGYHSEVAQNIKKMLVRGVEIGDISEIESISVICFSVFLC